MTDSHFLGGDSMGTATENKTLKRLRILDAANHLFLNGSVADTAIDDVVKLAGVAKGTFYLYFRDKYDLLDRIVVYRAMEIFTGNCALLRARAVQTPMTAAEQIIFLSDRIADYLETHKKEAALLDKRFSACFSCAQTEQSELFYDALSYLTELLVSETCTVEQARQKLYLLGNMILYSACDAALGGKPYTAEQIRPTLHAMIRGILDGGDKA